MNNNEPQLVRAATSRSMRYYKRLFEREITSSGPIDLDGIGEALQHGVDPNTRVRHQNRDNFTAMTAASLHDNVPLMQLLIENGAGWSFPRVLHVAVLGGNLPMTRLVVQIPGIDVNHLHFGFSALHFGVLRPDNPNTIADRQTKLEVVRVLIQAGASANQLCNAGSSPLHLVTNIDDGELLRILLSGPGIKVDALNADRCTALQTAAVVGSAVAARQLVKAGANVQAVHRNGYTLAHFAASTEILVVLKNTGAPLDNADHNGYTPLLRKLCRGEMGLVRWLATAGGADVTRRFGPGQLSLAHCAQTRQQLTILQVVGAPLNVLDYYGITPLMAACTSGKIEIVQWLVQEGCVDPMKESHDGWSNAFLDACFSKCSTIVKWFIDQGIFNARSKSSGGCTPLFAACRYSSCTQASEEACVQLVWDLLRQQDEMFRTYEANQFLLELAATWSPGICRLLVEYGYDLMGRVLHTKKSRCRKLRHFGIPLHTAVGSGTIETTKCLAELMISQGLSLDAIDYLGWTPLHVAVSHCNLEKVKFLLDKGCNVNAQTEHGHTPLHIVSFGIAHHKEYFKMGRVNKQERKKARKALGYPFNSLAARDIHSLLLNRGADPSILDESKQVAICKKNRLSQVFRSVMAPDMLGYVMSG